MLTEVTMVPELNGFVWQETSRGSFLKVGRLGGLVVLSRGCWVIFLWAGVTMVLGPKSLSWQESWGFSWQKSWGWGSWWSLLDGWVLASVFHVDRSLHERWGLPDGWNLWLDFLMFGVFVWVFIWVKYLGGILIRVVSDGWGWWHHLSIGIIPWDCKMKWTCSSHPWFWNHIPVGWSHHASSVGTSWCLNSL